MTTHRRRGPGLGPTGRDPSPRTARGLVDTHTHTPARLRTAHGHRGTSHGPRTSSGPMGSNHLTTEVPRGPTGNTRSPTTSSDSHMQTTVHSGTGPGWDHYGPRLQVPIPASHHLDQPARGHHWYARQHWEYATPETSWHSSNPQAQTAAWEHAYSSGRTASGNRFPPYAVFLSLRHVDSRRASSRLAPMEPI